MITHLRNNRIIDIDRHLLPVLTSSGNLLDSYRSASTIKPFPVLITRFREVYKLRWSTWSSLDTAVQRRVRRRGDTLCHARPAGRLPPGRRRRRDDPGRRRCRLAPNPHHRRRRRSPLCRRLSRRRAVADFRRRRSTPARRLHFRFNEDDVAGHLVDDERKTPWHSTLNTHPAISASASTAPPSPTPPTKPTNTDFRFRNISTAFQPNDNR